jgi:hypothetical protein
MKNNSGRAVIYAKDIMNITGRGKTFCYELMKAIKIKNNKEGVCFVSIHEFCEHTGLKEEQVMIFIK